MSRTSDIIVVGGGVIGLALAWELRRRDESVSVRLLERGEPGREASWAAAGMLAPDDVHTAPELVGLARASATLYPEWVRELEEASGMRVDLRREGTLLLVDAPGRGAEPTEPITGALFPDAANVPPTTESDGGSPADKGRRASAEEIAAAGAPGGFPSAGAGGAGAPGGFPSAAVGGAGARNRETGTEEERIPEGGSPMSAEELEKLEPMLAGSAFAAVYMEEMSVDPRGLVGALREACKRAGVEVASGVEVTGVEMEGAGEGGPEKSAGRASAQGRARVTTSRGEYTAGSVVNCCGAWAGMVGPVKAPVRPVKGQMVALIPSRADRLRHVVRRGDSYIVPRSDGRVLAGATVEEAGFDKNVSPEAILRLHQEAANMVPELGEARIHESWAGLRPGTPDALPILGVTGFPGYYMATGHFRNGILLAPITARVMANLMLTGNDMLQLLAPFSVLRFE